MGEHKKQQLHPKYLTIVGLLYSYRFSTRHQLAQGIGMNDTVNMYRSLEFLLAAGLVGRLYKPSYKLLGKPAVYYLDARGYRYIRDFNTNSSVEITDNIINSAYRTYSDSFVNQCLAIVSLSLVFTMAYPSLRFYTKRSTHGLWFIPDRPPDGYIVLPKTGESREQTTQPPQKVDYFYLDLLPATGLRQELRERFASYNDLFESHVLQDDHIALPTLLLVCRSQALEHIAIEYVSTLLKEAYYHTECYSTTLDRLKNLTPDKPNIWIDVKDPGELFALDDLPEFEYISPEDLGAQP